MLEQAGKSVGVPQTWETFAEVEVRRLRVVVLGYYHVLNAGDDLLLAALTHVFREHDLLVSKWFPGVHVLNVADLVVVGGGSIWPGHTVFEWGSTLARRLSTNLMVLGVSCKHAEPRLLPGTHALADRAAYFCVRDAESLTVLGGHPRIQRAPDLYWWAPHHIAALPVAEGRIRVVLNLRSWLPVPWQPEQIVDVVRKLGCDAVPWPLYYGSPVHEVDGEESDAQLLQRICGAPTPESFSVEPLGAARLAVCMRYHAVLMSVRRGIPVVAFDYHAKITAFYADHGLSELCVPLDDAGALEAALVRVLHAYDAYRLKFQAVRETLLQDAAAHRAQVERLLQTLPVPKRSIARRIRAMLVR